MPATRARAACSAKCPRTTTRATKLAAYRLAGADFPGYFGIFYKTNKPTKNAKEGDIQRGMMEKLKGLKDWEILQKSFDRMK